MSPPRITALRRCARCGGDHERIEWQEFTYPVEAEEGVLAYTFTHWAPCPANGEPILMRITEDAT